MLRFTSGLIFLSLILMAPSMMAQVEWIPSDENPVFTIGEQGAWDSQSMTADWLLKVGNEYVLWYHGLSAVRQTGSATSSDLIHWVRYAGNPTLPGSIDDWDESTGNLCVLHDLEQGAPYKMWYSGRRGVDFANPGQIGFAISADGLLWNKFEGNPVLEASLGGWDNSSVTTPSVVFDKTQSPPIYRMWYDGHVFSDCSSGKFGYAESVDGAYWRKDEGNPVLSVEGAEDVPFAPKVLFDEDSGTFEMWYCGRCTETLYYATSLDGITWTKYRWNPLAIGGWYTGAILREGNVYHRIYNSSPGGQNFSFHYATSQWTLPKASFTLTLPPDNDDDAVEVTADAARSTAPAPPIKQYSWDFGDGATSEGVQVSHTYTKVGAHLLKLTVTDSAGEEGSVARKVYVDFRPLPVAPWTGEDIGVGTVSRPGGTRPVGECLETLGGVGSIGFGIFSSTDTFHFVHRTANGDFCLTAHLTDWNADLFTSSIGLMARASLDPGAPEVSVNLQKTPSGGRYLFLTRFVENDRTEVSLTATSNAEEAWLRLERYADEFIASTSPDGTNWTVLGRATLPMPQESQGIEVGLAAVDGSGPNERDYAVARVCSLDLVTSCETRTFFHRGDPNADGTTDVSDATSTFGFLYLGNEAPTCKESADANNDGTVDISDGISLLNWLFLGGPEPALPGPPSTTCGFDPDAPGSPGDVGCERYGPCE